MNRKNKIIVLSVCILLCFAAAGGTFAWYKRAEAKRAMTEGAVVMAPYNLYLLNPDGRDALQFAVGNLHPGEVKQTVICVSNNRPKGSADEGTSMSDLAKDSAFGYDLMLVHTDNLAVNYKIYLLNTSDSSKYDIITEGKKEDGTVENHYWTKAADSLNGKDISETNIDGTAGMRKKVFGDKNTDNTVNVGTYWLSNDDSMQLTYKASENRYQYDYYLIEITWKDDVFDFSAYKKETDMVYVVVNAKQPRPVEKRN